MLNYTGNRKKIIEYMQYQVMHHMDGAHVNCTALAEDAWNQCESGEDIHPDFFEWAYEVACEFEAYINQLEPDELEAMVDEELSYGEGQQYPTCQEGYENPLNCTCSFQWE